MTLAGILDRLRGSRRTLTFLDEQGVETVKTFHDLHADVLALVQRLDDLGVQRGCRVGIAAPSHYAFMVWDLACIAKGCVSVVMPNEPPRRALGELVQAYRLTLLAVEPDWLRERAHEAQPRVVSLQAAAAPEAAVTPLPVADDPRTHSLVFSSGTTGKVKGLIISAPGTEHLVNLYREAFGVAEGERFLTFLPFANYQQRMTYYFCLANGVDFVSVPYPRLFAGLKQYRPSFVIAPPILYESLQVMARAAAGPQSEPAALRARLHAITGGNVRYMVTGMAPIKRATLDFFWDSGIPLYEAFGITEAGMVAWNKPGQVNVGTAGRPAEYDSVSLAEDGEVIVTRQALLSLGYFESSEEDARATFCGPCSVATGDIGSFDADGFLTVVGRKKDAIITKNGEKFHPEPLEALLQGEPRVHAAVVVGTQHAGLSAVICSRQHADPEVEKALRAHVVEVNAGLPAQQQIRQLVFTERDFTVDNGLRTANLKLNRKAIAAAFFPEG